LLSVLLFGGRCGANDRRALRRRQEFFSENYVFKKKCERGDGLHSLPRKAMRSYSWRLQRIVMQKQITDDPYWPRASAWLAGEFAPSSSGGLAVIGAPLRLGSITPGRCDLAPAAVRAILRKFSVYDIE
jgi:hypothetical protein